MNEELKKSLTDLIDETLIELEELKKSRYAAAEVQIKGPGEGIAGKPSDGDLHAKKAEDEEDEKKKKEEAAKGEGANAEKSESAAKAEDEKKDEKKDDKKEDKEPQKDDPKEDKEKPKFPDMKKSEDAPKAAEPLRKSDEEYEALMKSYVDERVKPLEDKLATILTVVNKIADQPVPAKGATARAVPLMKSTETAVESLSKSEIASKLFELKKSGTFVDSLDITRAEMGHDLHKIVEKYKIS
jgi:hypothetical protein